MAKVKYFVKQNLLRSLAALLMGVALSSCAPGRLAVATGAGRCFSALPIAQKAMTSQNDFLGVRAIDRKTAQRMLSTEITSTESYFCVVAYRLRNPSASTVSQVIDRFSLVVVAPNAKKVLGLEKVSRLPFSFSRNLSVG